MLSWRIAAMLPIVIVIAAITTIGLAQPSVPNGMHVAAERDAEHADHRGDRGRLDRRRHERGDRRRRALVRIGRPHVERDRGDLEAERDDEQERARDHEAGVLRSARARPAS